MTDAYQIIARGPRADAEAAAEAIDADITLEGATYSILEEDEDRNIWRIDAFPTTEEEADGLMSVLAGFAALTSVKEKLADADWLAMALSGLPPVRAGRFFVFGAHDEGIAPLSAVTLRIEAGAAFGTGHHGTTVGCLLAYDALLKKRRFKRVLDVGAGTGVLAIAAARTGTPIAVGTDIDAPSVRISNENARLNGAAARFVHANGLNHKDVARHAPYDLVFANILARPLISLSQDIKLALKPAASPFCPVCYAPRNARCGAAYIAKGFRVVSHIHRDAWATLVLTRAG